MDLLLLLLGTYTGTRITKKITEMDAMLFTSAYIKMNGQPKKHSARICCACARAVNRMR